MFWMWTGFIVLVLLMLAFDLGVLNRTDHVVKVREALLWSSLWIGLALAFNVFIYFAYQNHWAGLGNHISHGFPDGMDGHEAAVVFFLGYVIEKSLSIDNIFVIALIFGYFGIPPKYQHRVLFWGILGALVMRGAMIALGAALIERFEWVIYIFGAFLIVTAYKMLTSHANPDPGSNPVIRLAQRLFPITHTYHGHAFVIRGSDIMADEDTETHFDRRTPADAANRGAGESQRDHGGGERRGERRGEERGEAGEIVRGEGRGEGRGEEGNGGEIPVPTDAGILAPAKPKRDLTKAKWVLTPLALALLVVETTDVIFAVDSIPAIFGITTDPFIVFTSNVFAILGLRALYFALAGVMNKFRYLKAALAAILGLVGLKMLFKNPLHAVPGLAFYTLGAIVLILTVAIVASIIASRREDRRTPAV